MKRVDLIRAGYDNWNTQPTGVDPEVLADIGYAATVHELVGAAERTLQRQIAQERLDPIDPVSRTKDLLSAVDFIGREGQFWGVRRSEIQTAAGQLKTNNDAAERKQRRDAAEKKRRFYFDSAKVMFGRALGHITPSESEMCFDRARVGGVAYSETDDTDAILQPETRAVVDTEFAEFLRLYGKPEKPTDMAIKQYRRRNTSATRARRALKIRLQRDLEQLQGDGEDSGDLQAA